MPEPLFEFFLPMKSPPTHTAQQGSRTTKTGHHYKDAELEQIKAQYITMMQPYKPDKPLPKAPYRIVTKWMFPHTKTSKNGQYKVSKPDGDNLIKALHDCIEKAGFVHNDSNFSSIIVEKFHADVTGVYIRIEAL